MENKTNKVVYSYIVYYRLSFSDSLIRSIHSKNFLDKSIREEVLFNIMEILPQFHCEIVQVRRIDDIISLSLTFDV